MELFSYWRIIKRRWWLLALVTLAALAVSTYVALRGAFAYQTDMTLAVSTIPTVAAATSDYYDPVYYSNLNSEYLADDLSEIIKSQEFGDIVSTDLHGAVSSAAIADVTRTKQTHRLIDVTLMTSTFDEGQLLGNEMARVLNDPNRVSQFLKALSAYQTQITIVDQPLTRRAATPTGLAAQIGLRTLIGLFLGIALVFLLDYLDQRFYDGQQASEVLGLPILGEIPRPRRGAPA